jgi:hypothetical protein
MARQHKWVKVMALSSCLMLMLISGPHFVGAVEYPYSDYGYFPETGYAVTGRFLDYWEDHGGLKQQGYPISDQIQEVSDIDGKSYSVQYFERAEFESHTEFFDKGYPNLHPPTAILLSLLGTLRYTKKYPYGAPNQRPNQSQGSIFFPQTGKRLGGSFLAYWQQYGGLAQQGYPISDEIQERSETDGQIYTVQYFERSVMEWHPGNTPPNDVLLSLLGTFRYNEKYGEVIQSLGTPRMISTAVVWEEVAGGHYIFYLRDDNPDPSPYDAVKALYGYDLTQNKEFLIKHTANELANMATDGQYLVWSEYARGVSDQNPQPVYSYDVVTGRALQIMTATMSTGAIFSDMSLDGGILYYGDSTVGHKGLYARNLVTNQEHLISQEGHEPVASEGAVLWQSGFYGGALVGSHTLHLTNLESIGSDAVITETSNTFSGYDISGGNVVWSYGDTIAPMYVYMYNLDNKSTDLLSVIGMEPHINNDKVVWTMGDISPISRYIPFHGKWVMSYDLNTRLAAPVTPREDGGESWAVDVIDNNTLVYRTGSGLFTRTLGCPCQP